MLLFVLMEQRSFAVLLDYRKFILSIQCTTLAAVSLKASS
ncbi:hypothetical protein GWL_13510 [Herbaspirillum sp. GW103]|nr:hypothetical protein GWL_13510 [Herbaspirillum sp. GW103]